MDNKPEHYQEGPWVYKRNGHYYMAFASTCCPEGIGYAMSDKATGPWTTKGYIMRPTERTRGNHPGIIDYKGDSYVFGLNYDLLHLETFDHKERRSTSIAKMHYNPDGTKGAKKFSVSAACVEKGGSIEICLDGADGPIVGNISISSTGGMDYWEFK